jgi:hypothetical protein
MNTLLYCDEAGHTGDGLRDAQQPFFAYAGVAVTAAESAELVAEVRALTRTSAPELKAVDLYKHSRGRDACKLLVERLAGRAAVVVHEKSLLLAANFYEYVFEPALAAHSLLFYREGFHRFITDMLYVGLSQGDSAAETLLTQFMASMRRDAGDDIALFAVLDQLRDESDSFVSAIVRFARTPAAQVAMKDQLQTISSPGGHIKNILDPSMTSFASILRTMSVKFGRLQVVLDHSKPLQDREELINHLGTPELVYAPAYCGIAQPINFTLSNPIRFGNSQDEPGLQLADLIAGFTAFAWRDANNPDGKRFEHGRRVQQLLIPFLSEGSVLFDLTQRRDETWLFKHLHTLYSLIERAEARQPLVRPEDLN